jgi:hypothetical protein
MGELEGEGAAAIRLSWARSKKKAPLLSFFHGLARRRRRCSYPSLMGSLEEEGAAAIHPSVSHGLARLLLVFT